MCLRTNTRSETTAGDVSEQPSSDSDAGERAITTCALQVFASEEASAKVLQGPGMAGAPRRYLGVTRPALLYLLVVEWCKQSGHDTPSFTTFCRALHESKGFLRFRKMKGEHPACDECWCLVQELTFYMQGFSCSS